MFRPKLYKPTLIIDDITITVVNSKVLTGLCGREIIAKQNGLNPNRIHDSPRLCHLTYMSIKYN
jgi:hypothetical protein